MRNHNKLQGFKNSVKTVVSAVIITVALASFSTPASAAILNVENGVLLGASEVSVSGNLYDVEFLDGTYDSVFGISPLIFTTEAEAVAAGNALLDQVFVNSPLGQFDNIGTFLTRGCSHNSQCSALTPYFINSSSSFSAQTVNDSDNDYDETGGNFLNLLSYQTINDPQVTFARWSVASVAAVPEPSTYGMMGLGLLGIMWMSRRRQDEV